MQRGGVVCTRHGALGKALEQIFRRLGKHHAGTLEVVMAVLGVSEQAHDLLGGHLTAEGTGFSTTRVHVGPLGQWDPDDVIPEVSGLSSYRVLDVPHGLQLMEDALLQASRIFPRDSLPHIHIVVQLQVIAMGWKRTTGNALGLLFSVLLALAKSKATAIFHLTGFPSHPKQNSSDLASG